MNIVMWKTGSIKLDNVVLKLIILKKINIMNMGEKIYISRWQRKIEKKSFSYKGKLKVFDDICTRIKFQDNMYHRVYIKYGCSYSYLLHLQK